MTQKKSLNGARFGRLVVTGDQVRLESGRVSWPVLCDCGTSKFVPTSPLLNGKTSSCGCLHREVVAAQNMARSTGATASPLYPRWTAIKNRCLNPQNRHYADYGGRGICLHPDWMNDFLSFERWVTENLGACPKGSTLDRIDNNGNYQPGNLRWATGKEQSANRRAHVRNSEADSYLGILYDLAWRYDDSDEHYGGNR